MKALEELAAIPQWVAHTSSKVPMGAKGAASSSDSRTWMTLEDAKMVRAQNGLAGVGFVMSHADAFVGVDLDNAVDEQGFVKPWADEIVRELCSYTEVSPSGRGLHIWVKGRLPPGPRRIKLGDGLLEVYDSGRYFTVTGRHVPGAPDCIAALSWLGQWYGERFPAPENMGARLDAEAIFEPVDVDEWIGGALDHVPASDYQVWLDVGMGLKDHFGEGALRLWNDWSRTAPNYAGEQDIAKRWRSFKSSGITIATVIKYAKENGFEPPPMRVVNPLPNVDWDGWGRSLADGDISAAAFEAGGQDFARKFFDLAEIARMPREYEPDVIGPGVLTAGDIMLLFGPPKSMKSMLILDWARCWGQGVEWYGLEPAGPLTMAYVQFEVKLDQVKRRVHAMGLGPEEIEALSKRVYITDRHVTSFGSATVLDELAREINGRLGGPPDLLVIDPLANVFTGDNENDNAQMSRFVAAVKYLRGKCGDKTAIILVHHTNKGDRRSRQADPFVSLRGASSLRGAYDAGVFVDRLTDDGDGQVVMKFELRNGPPIEKKTLAYEHGRFQEVVPEGFGAAVLEAVKEESPRQKALRGMVDAVRWGEEAGEELLSAEGWHRAKYGEGPAWAESLMKDIPSPRSRVSELIDEGRLWKTSEGKISTQTQVGAEVVLEVVLGVTD